MKRFFQETRGGAALETAMVVPVWVTLFTIMIQMTLIWWSKSVVQHAAARAARVAVVQIPQKMGGEPRNCANKGGNKLKIIQSAAEDTLKALHLGTFKRVDVKLDRRCYAETAEVTLEVVYRMPLTVPVASTLLGELHWLGRIRTLETKVSMRNEGLKLRPGA